MALDIVIKNGNVVLTDGVYQVDIGIKDGSIAIIAEDITEETEEIIDASNQFVLPGMVDTHVHISEPGRTEWEGFVTGTKALAAGGTTSYVEMPLNAIPATIDQETLNLKLTAAKGKNYVDYAFYGGLVPGNIDQLEELIAAGVPAFKCFMAEVKPEVPGDFMSVDDYTLYKGMEKLAELGQILCIHAENPEITTKLTEEMIREGRTSPGDYVDSRPIFTEVEAVQRALLFAKETGCKLHFVHISSSEAIQRIVKARESGMDVTVESCPHYFALTAEDVEQIGPRAKCQPPLRRTQDQEKLWDELLAGNIDWLASDHSPCTEELKEGNIFEVWGGISGAQNSVDLMFDLAVKHRGMPVHEFAKRIAANPAKRFQLPNKGALAVTKDADIILIDPNREYVVERENLYYKNKHSAYEGRKIGCRVTKTIVRGNVVYDIEQGIVGRPAGELMTVKQK